MSLENTSRLAKEPETAEPRPRIARIYLRIQPPPQKIPPHSTTPPENTSRLAII
jgi:hypothetical protein